MNYLKNLVKKHGMFFFVLSLAFFLRFYRLDQLTTFGGDQGQDFLVVKDMVLYHKWTLLGIKTSIGPFFQGPVYLYLLYPFFVVFRLQPIAGAIAAVFFSISTIILLYMVCLKYFSKETALFSTLFFAVSPEFVKYGATPLYQHFLPFFIVLSLFIFLHKKDNLLLSVLLGITVGIGIELHLLNTSLGLAYFLFYLLFLKNIKKIISYFLGMTIGVSPTIFFELRHQFLNTRLILNYQNSTSTTFSPIKPFYQIVKGAAEFLAGNLLVLGAALLVAMVFLLLVVKTSSSSYAKIKKLTFLTIVITFLLSFKFATFGAHYFLPVWIFLVILLPFMVLNIFPKKIAWLFLFLLVVFNFLNSLGRLNDNHGYGMPPGLTLQKIDIAGDIVSQDSKTHPNFNVASILDGNTRNYPLRYTSQIRKAQPGTVESYQANDYLYLMSDSNKEKIHKNNTWEVNSLRPFSLEKQWSLGDNIYLYRLDRIKNTK